MVSDEVGKQLHHKFSIGQILSKTEQKQLKAWYDYQDKQELTAIQMPNTILPFPDLQKRIETTLAQLVELTHRIQQITTDNERLRKQNSLLISQLPNFLIKKSA